MLQKDKKTNSEVVLPNTGRHPAKDESLIGELPADCNHDRWLRAANPKNVVAFCPVEKIMQLFKGYVEAESESSARWHYCRYR